MGAAVNDVSGDDITIHGSASVSGNEFELFYSSTIDGPWTSLGTASSTQSFDIGGATAARYFRIEDNGFSPSNTLGAGFHLDAITANSLSSSIIQNNPLAKINIYPNPTSGKLFIDYNEQKNIETIKIFDNRGALVSEYKNTHQIDLSFLSNGIYFIQCYASSSIITNKIIKQ